MLKHREQPLTLPLTDEQKAVLPYLLDELKRVRVMNAQIERSREPAKKKDQALHKALKTPRPVDGWGSAEAPDGGLLYLTTAAVYEEINDLTQPGTVIAAYTRNDQPGLHQRSRRRVQYNREMGQPRPERLQANVIWRRFVESSTYAAAIEERQLLDKLCLELQARREPPKNAPQPPAPPSAAEFLRGALADSHEHQGTNIRAAARAADFTDKQIRAAREQLEASGEIYRPRRDVWRRGAGS